MVYFVCCCYKCCIASRTWSDFSKHLIRLRAMNTAIRGTNQLYWTHIFSCEIEFIKDTFPRNSIWNGWLESVTVMFVSFVLSSHVLFQRPCLQIKWCVNQFQHGFKCGTFSWVFVQLLCCTNQSFFIAFIVVLFFNFVLFVFVITLCNSTLWNMNI